ncbi:MAG TPA: hypothetical protein VFI65_07985 [Streptosporangiaceae bacterium]|nr:hypothetical protein [Streptosporangiaceae bacterium]
MPARRVVRIALARGRRAVAHPEYWRVVRGAFLAPWFAVSLGIVVAASLSLATPRAALSFPPTDGGSNAPHKPARNTSSGPTAAVNRQAPVHGPVDPEAWSGRQVLVRYRLMTQRRGQFMAMIAISSRRPLGNWRLRFLLPGASVKSIMWGQWAKDVSGAVVVYGVPAPWPRSAPSQARIVISGTGAPQWPKRCAYNGTHCAFGQLEP